MGRARTVSRGKPAKAKPAAASKPTKARKAAPKPVKAAVVVEPPPIDIADLCQSCGKRPGKKAAIRGQLIGAQLCDFCAAARKERIRVNRAALRRR